LRLNIVNLVKRYDIEQPSGVGNYNHGKADTQTATKDAAVRNSDRNFSPECWNCGRRNKKAHSLAVGFFG
jgi:hypothetical protein